MLGSFTSRSVILSRGRQPPSRPKRREVHEQSMIVVSTASRPYRLQCLTSKAGFDPTTALARRRRALAIVNGEARLRAVNAAVDDVPAVPPPCGGLD